ncbi:ATP-binding protein [Coralloluteibacterium stylophorae]|uniref:histidine kinase n=1 Tax=Coralloluteibacterium stylophorae TaxID=1776034 RepID=A0A8J7VT83_9GAMM|nr:ATP-binding protein [Coralloluteibacterium stylophorae]MBS7458210.1 two-component sensor histidine kinase [Coralloluteibacterium stylophorae]
MQARQLLAASLGFVAFLGVTGFALDRAFVEVAENGLRERLKSYAYAYLGSMEFQRRSNALVPPEYPPDPRFDRPRSGLYAVITGAVQWRSPSAMTSGQMLPELFVLPLNTETFEGPLPSADAAANSNLAAGQFYVYARGVGWEDGDNAIDYTLLVIEDAAAIDRQINIFRRALWVYLGGAGILLLMLQTGVQRWSLRPLRRVVGELAHVQRGGAQGMSGEHPRELEPLTESINAFIVSEREHLDRYRNTLADLAHSLKTPLAVLRSRLESETDDRAFREEVANQIQRMSDLVSYQLSRAATTGHQLFAAPLEITPIAEEIVRSLEKVYAAKGVLCEFEIDEGARFHGEPGDLQELLGNLLENAFKWARKRVLLVVARVDGGDRRDGVQFSIEDDGPGIPPEQVDRLLQRGVRGDERVQGHGIGLAIVQDLVRAYRGNLMVYESTELGGARFLVTIPPGL